MVDFHVLRIGKVFDTKELFACAHTILSKRNRFLLFVHLKIHGRLQAHHESVCRLVEVGRLCAGAGNNQRGSGFVDQNGVHFVDDGVVELALHQVLAVDDHIVAEVIKAKLVVCAVGDVCHISLSPLLVCDAVHHAADSQTEEAVQLSHPLRVTLCEVVIYCDNMHTLARNCVQISRQRCDKRLTFTCLHFSYVSAVEHYAADQLHLEVLHAKRPPRRLTAHGKGFYHHIVEAFALFVSLSELCCFCAQLLVGESLHLRLECQYVLYLGVNLFNLLFARIPKYFFH